MIEATSKIELPLLANEISIPMLCQGDDAYIFLSFFDDLGVSRKELESIIESEENSWTKEGLKVYFEGKVYSVIPRSLAVKIISRLSEISSQPVFKTIHRQLLKLSLDSEVVVDSLAEDFRSDEEFWQQKLIELSRLSRQKMIIPVHPGLEISEDGEYYNHEALGFIFVDQIANFHLAEDHGRNARTKLLEMLLFQSRDGEYHFFLYQILTGDINICLLAQTMFADWISAIFEQQQL